MTTDGRSSALIVRGWPGQDSPLELERHAERGQRPRSPHVELARALDADIIDFNYLREHGGGVSKTVARRIGVVEGQVLETFRRRRQYRHIVAFADRIGLELALLFKLTRSRRDLALVSNWLASPAKRPFFDRVGVQSHLGTIVGYGSVQLELVATRHGIAQDRLHIALQPVDELFWRPSERLPEDLVCSVGCFTGYRDYATLIEAVAGLPVRAELAVGSLLLSPAHQQERARIVQSRIPAGELPPNVEYRMELPPTQLRDLYERSQFVVIPLEEVDFDAGVTSITEAMAMGKAVVVTRNRGQVDVVRDGVEGLYVPPKDPSALREAIQHLLDHPDEARRMGEAGRATVLARHRITDWASRVAAIVQRS